jgi:hypothetical protein
MSAKLHRLYWLSFCEDKKPEGEKFLGACMIVATDTIEAVKLAHEKKINPGGQVMSVNIPVTDEEIAHAEPYLNRLLTAEECIAFDAHMGGEGKVIAAKDFDERLSPDVVCDPCNEEIDP